MSEKWHLGPLEGRTGGSRKSLVNRPSPHCGKPSEKNQSLQVLPSEEPTNLRRKCFEERTTAKAEGKRRTTGCSAKKRKSKRKATIVKSGKGYPSRGELRGANKKESKACEA